MKKIFITATDTDAGKTFVSCAIIAALTQQHNKTVAAYKPVAAGCDLVNGNLVNEDAKWLTYYANSKQTLNQVNPIAFLEPIAPHIAAKKHNQSINVSDLTDHFTSVTALNADITLVEGAGGWRLPLSITQSSNIKENDGSNRENQFLADFVKENTLDVILVVNMKLGCLNHALLTYEAIKSDGLNCIAWVANCVSPEKMSNLADNISELEQLFPMPKIAELSYIEDTIHDDNSTSNRAGKIRSFTDKITIAASLTDLTILL
jgi:dethiobiotin synthetase